MTNWITIKGPFGKKLAAPGYVLAPWESVERPEERTPDERMLDSAARHFGMDIADFLEWAARCFGIPPCPKCRMSKVVLYRMNEIGWLRGVALLWRVRWKRAPTFTELDELCRD